MCLGRLLPPVGTLCQRPSPLKHYSSFIRDGSLEEAFLNSICKLRGRISKLFRDPI